VKVPRAIRPVGGRRHEIDPAQDSRGALGGHALGGGGAATRCWALPLAWAVADGDGLTGGSGSGRCGGTLYLTRTDATGKPTANLVGSVELSAGECASPGDECPRAAIIWSLSLKEPENPVGAVGGPGGDKAAVGFAERVWRSHDPFLYVVGQANRGRTRRRPPSVARGRRRSHCMPVELDPRREEHDATSRGDLSRSMPNVSTQTSLSSSISTWPPPESWSQ
jgi:hypothetical protein